MVVWKIRGKIVCAVLSTTVMHNDMHTHI